MKEITIKLSPKSILKLFLIVLLILAIFGAGFFAGRWHYEKTELTTLDNCKPLPNFEIIVKFDFDELKKIVVKKDSFYDVCDLYQHYVYSNISK